MPTYYMTDIEYDAGGQVHGHRVSMCWDAQAQPIVFKLWHYIGYLLGLSSFGDNPYQATWPSGNWVVSWTMSYLGGSMYDPDLCISSSGGIGAYTSDPPNMGCHSFSFSASGPHGAQGVGQSVGAGISFFSSAPYDEYMWVSLSGVTLTTCVPIGIRPAMGGASLTGGLTFNGDASHRIPHKFIRVGPERLGKAIRIDSANLGKIIRI